MAQTTFADLSATVALPAGLHTIAISFTNDYGTGCDRNLRVDKVTVSP